MEKCHNVRRCDTAAVSPECGDLLCKVTGRGPGWAVVARILNVIKSKLPKCPSHELTWRRGWCSLGPDVDIYWTECKQNPRWSQKFNLPNVTSLTLTSCVLTPPPPAPLRPASLSTFSHSLRSPHHHHHHHHYHYYQDDHLHQLGWGWDTQQLEQRHCVTRHDVTLLVSWCQGVRCRHEAQLTVALFNFNSIYEECLDLKTMKFQLSLRWSKPAHKGSVVNCFYLWIVNDIFYRSSDLVLSRSPIQSNQ